MSRTITHIVIHCTATHQTATVESIKHYWKSQLGWKDPGYHVIVRPDGSAVELLPIDKVSNGVKGHNSHSIHISYIGGVEKNGRPLDNRTPQQKETLLAYLIKWKAIFPDAQILGHRDFSPDINGNGIIDPWERIKECPSFSVANWIKEYPELQNTL